MAWRVLARRVARAALERAPAEVRAAALAAPDEVDLLDRVLPHVADRQVARAAVEGEAPGVAQTVAVDLGAGAVAAAERVVGGDAVGPAARGGRVDAQQLAEQRRQVLRVAARAVLVARAAAVTGADVEVHVGPEQQQPAVVIALGVRHAQDEARRAAVGAGGARALVLDDALVAGPVGEVDVEAARARVVGREGDRQEALLAPGLHLAADVEERALAATADDHDPPGLLDHEHALAVLRRRGHVDGGGEAPDRPELGAAAGGRLRRGGGLLARRRGGCRGGRGRRRRAGVVPARAARCQQHAGGQNRQSCSPHGATGWQDNFSVPDICVSL